MKLGLGILFLVSITFNVFADCNENRFITDIRYEDQNTSRNRITNPLTVEQAYLLMCSRGTSDRDRLELYTLALQNVDAQLALTRTSRMRAAARTYYLQFTQSVRDAIVACEQEALRGSRRALSNARFEVELDSNMAIVHLIDVRLRPITRMRQQDGTMADTASEYSTVHQSTLATNFGNLGHLRLCDANLIGVRR